MNVEEEAIGQDVLRAELLEGGGAAGDELCLIFLVAGKVNDDLSRQASCVYGPRAVFGKVASVIGDDDFFGKSLPEGGGVKTV